MPTIEAAFRGDPISATHQPDPAEIVAALTDLENAVADAGSGRELDAVMQLDDPLVVLATGQSNMLGGSTPSGAARVVRNPNVYVWSQATLSWIVTAPGDVNWPFLSVGNNLAYVYADARQKARGGIVMLFMHAVGGQEIAEWLPNGGGVSGATGALWAALNSRWTSARAALIPNRTDSATLSTLGINAAHEVVFHQMEADIDANGTTGAQWKARLLAFLRNARDPLGNGLTSDPLILPQAPVLIGEALYGGDDDRNVEARELDRSEPLIALVSSDGLTGSDSVHFDATSLVEFGRRYADRVGIFPKLVPIENSLTDVDLGGRMRMLTISAVTVPASGTLPIDINSLFGVTMASTGYVPTIAPVSVAGAQVYIDNSSWTNTGFTLANPNGTNSGVVRIQIIGLVQ